MEKKQTMLIPRKKLFNDTFKGDVQISGSGKYISFLYGENGDLKLWSAETVNPDNAELIFSMTDLSFSGYSWVNTDDYIVCFSQKSNGQYVEFTKIDLLQKKTDKLLINSMKFQIVPGRFASPGKIPVIGYPDSNPTGNLYILDTSKIELKLLYKNNEGFDWFICDINLNLKYAAKINGHKCIEFYIYNPDSTWTKSPVKNIEQWQIIGCYNGHDSLYIIDNENTPSDSLFKVDMISGNRVCITSHPKADFDYHLIIEPKNGKILAAGIFYIQLIWCVIDDDVQDDFTILNKFCKGHFNILCQSLDNNVWLVEFYNNKTLPEYLLYDRKLKKIKYLFSADQTRRNLNYYPMHFNIVSARDSLELLCYYTIPSVELAERPFPTVLLVHGGPWNRDFWGYNPMHQWLANRGYAVISVNFRGSSGFGHTFLNAGSRQWGRSMQNDLIDTVNHFIHSGISDPLRIAIIGNSYGGYASLMALAQNSDFFKCGIAYAGPLNLITMLNSVHFYSPILKTMSLKHVGKTDNEEERKRLLELSPLFNVHGIQKPLLIGYGEHDIRVLQNECLEFANILQKNNIPITYVRFTEEGHMLTKKNNLCAFLALAEVFLAQHLGGKSEEIGNSLGGTTISIHHGASHIPGLQKAYEEFTYSLFESYVSDLD
jgi:pimeloyl-ACP methyl ester carboxylesterase